MKRKEKFYEGEAYFYIADTFTIALDYYNSLSEKTAQRIAVNNCFKNYNNAETRLEQINKKAKKIDKRIQND